MVMLDTDFIVAVLRGEKNAIARMHAFKMARQHLCMSTVTVFELLRGVQRGKNPQKDRETYAQAIGEIYPIDFTYIEADLAAYIDAHLAKNGAPIGVPDTLIAATALSIRHPIVTRNAKHFEKIPGLHVETW